MSRQTVTIEQTASWDLVVTTSGIIILVVPSWIDVEIVIAADDGIVLNGSRPIHLMGSARIVPYVRGGQRLLLIQAGDGAIVEKVVPVVIHNGSMRARRQHAQSAAA